VAEDPELLLLDGVEDHPCSRSARPPPIRCARPPIRGPVALNGTHGPAVRRHGIEHRIIVAGFDPAAARPLRGAGFALGACTSDVACLLLPALLRRRVAPPLFLALCIPPRRHGVPVPIAALARALRESGTVIHVWTVNDPAYALRLWREGVQGILSDGPRSKLATRKSA
jgi:glycerophosphoryl diester phosphodiesterase